MLLQVAGSNPRVGRVMLLLGEQGANPPIAPETGSPSLLMYIIVNKHVCHINKMLIALFLPPSLGAVSALSEESFCLPASDLSLLVLSQEAN